MLPIARMYESEARAREVVQALHQAGFSEKRIRVVPPGPDAEGALERAAEQGFVSRGALARARKGLDAGHALVSAFPSLYEGAATEELMASFDPVAIELPASTGSSGTPLSDFLGIPTLTKSQKPFFGALTGHDFALSKLVGMPLLTKSGKPLFGGLTRHNFALSSMVGIPLLTKKGGPMFGVGLREPKKPWEWSFGLPLLSKDPTPFSSFLGIGVLSKRSEAGGAEGEAEAAPPEVETAPVESREEAPSSTFSAPAPPAAPETGYGGGTQAPGTTPNPDESEE